MIHLSILICTLPSRKENFEALMYDLLPQIGSFYKETIEERDYRIDKYLPVGKGKAEIIVCTDNKLLKVGEKRNLLVKHASGKYITHVDDDDKPSDLYVKTLLAHMAGNPDVIVFDVARYHNGQPDKMVNYGIENRQDYDTSTQYFRMPNHLMCVKKSIADFVPFKHINFGEDADYAKRLLPRLKTQERIPHTLYEYWFDEKKTETAK